jgi:hypothetical protein
MKKIGMLMGTMALLILTIPDDVYSKSSQNKAECQQWCNANKPRCAFCDSAAFCKGRTYDVIKSFKKGTGNWYACGLSEYGQASQKNKADCEAYCKKKDWWCKFCRSSIGCGSGYTTYKIFSGKGENWYACGLTSREYKTRANKDECYEFCENNADCDFCSSNMSCKPWSGGFSAEYLKKFGGGGENWYACRYTARGLLTQERQKECEKMCESSDFCDFCTTSRGNCASGKKIVARLRGRGETVYACKKRD